MPLDEREWRPITFQGVTFPATLMGAAILEPVLSIEDSELGDWIWRFGICRGVTKHASAELCTRCARKIVDLMLENRQRILDGIRDRLGPHGFDADATFRDWVMAFQQIGNLSAIAEGECVWSAPSHQEDMKLANWQRFMLTLKEKN